LELGGSDIAYYYTCNPPTVGKWYFACFTYDYPSSTAYYYLNGKQYVATWRSSVGTATAGTGDLIIGGGECGYSNVNVANIQIYNTALTQQEIQYLYQQGLGGGPVRLGSLVGWWPLNGDAKDYSGNNNHGTIYGGVTFVQNYNPP
jgi:hypothetical protein